MPENKKISDISKQLTEENHIPVTPKELNLMLIATGDLVDTAIGKIETKQGRKRGITGEYRTPAGKDPYWIPLYNEDAFKYVLELAKGIFSERVTMPIEENLPSVQPNTLRTEEPVNHEARHSEEASCMRCKLYINDECGMPTGICSFYEPCFIPTAQDIEIMAAAHEGFGVVGSMLNQDALGVIHYE